MNSYNTSIHGQAASDPTSGINIIVLAAGKSERMGIPKALLPFNNELTLIEFLVKRYQSIGFDSIFVVHNQVLKPEQFSSLQMNWVLNEQPELGRMHSIQLGLNASGSSAPCILHPVDQPFVDPFLIRSMISEVEPYDYAVPVYLGQGGHPVLLGPGVQEYIRNHPDEEHLKIVLQRFTRKEVACRDPRILLNINTMPEYQAFLNSLPHE